MDLELAAVIGCLFLLLAIVGLLFYQRRVSQGGSRAAPDAPVGPAVAARRAPVQRGLRQRVRPQAAAQHESDEDVDTENIELPDGKIGAKKLAKLQAKADRKSQREAEEKDREDRKKRQLALEEERLKAAELDAEDEKRREEEERKAREEKERKEHEEYLRMKAAFSVEEEGFEEEDGDKEINLLKEFVNFIKDNKVVVLEDIASNFKLKTQNVIDRIQDLQNDGILTGVVDDRGKFIYISQEELESVAKFVKQRGRVSIADLVESSNQLINLNPSTAVV